MGGEREGGERENHEELLAHKVGGRIEESGAAHNQISSINVTCFLLDRQIERLEQDFLKEDGLRERMTRARLVARSRQAPPN